MDHDGETPKLHVDSDWKAEAERERERLAAEEAKHRAEAPGGDRGLPPAEFRTVVTMLASQAIMGLGTMQDPQTGGIVLDFEGSRLAIDLLAVLEEKTKGNLTDEEADELQQIVVELRSRYVELIEFYRRQQAQSPEGRGPGGVMLDPGAGARGGVGGSPPPGSGGSPIITP